MVNARLIERRALCQPRLLSERVELRLELHDVIIAGQNSCSGGTERTVHGRGGSRHVTFSSSSACSLLSYLGNMVGRLSRPVK